jgi:hypothetical protein
MRLFVFIELEFRADTLIYILSRMYYKIIYIWDFEYVIFLLDWLGKQMLGPSLFHVRFQGYLLVFYPQGT